MKRFTETCYDFALLFWKEWYVLNRKSKTAETFENIIV